MLKELPSLPFQQSLPTADPYWMQRLHNMVNMNLLLQASPLSLSPPIKMPFGGLSHQIFSPLRLTDEQQTSIDLLRLKAKQVQDSKAMPT